jgi:hypothetical protein
VSSRLGWALEAGAILAAIAVAVIPLPPSFIEGAYANGLFARLNVIGVTVSNAFPFALGDLLIGAVAVLGIAGWARSLRRARGRRLAVLARLAGHTAVFGAVVVLAFELCWGWNYRRAPVVTRVAYAPSQVTDRAVRAFAERIVGILNADVAAAHARAAADPAEVRAQLARDFAPVVARLGDTWAVALTRPKPTVADIVYEMAGVGGQYNPYTFETLLNASFLPYEIPRALAHEWAHVAGFADEGDANLIGTVACLRSPDPLIRYSGAFWTYAELPDTERARLPLNGAVRADMEASRARFLRFYQPRVFAVSWRVYDRYLRAQGVAAGVASYSGFVRIMVGTPFDADGLPLAGSAGSKRQLP